MKYEPVVFTFCIPSYLVCIFKIIAFQSPPLCQTPGCRSVRNRSTLLSPSHPDLYALHPQGFQTRFAFLAVARRSFGRAPPPTKKKKSSRAQHCLNNALTPGYLFQGHGCTRSSDGPCPDDDAKQDPVVVYGAEFGVVFLAKGPRTTTSIHGLARYSYVVFRSKRVDRCV